MKTNIVSLLQYLCKWALGNWLVYVLFPNAHYNSLPMVTWLKTHLGHSAANPGSSGCSPCKANVALVSMLLLKGMSWQSRHGLVENKESIVARKVELLKRWRGRWRQHRKKRRHRDVSVCKKSGRESDFSAPKWHSTQPNTDHITHTISVCHITCWSNCSFYITLLP